MCRDCVELKKFNSSGRHDLLCPTKVVRIWLPIGGQDAGVAHPVERHLAKVEVASSSLVARSKRIRNAPAFLISYGTVAKW